MCYKTSRGVYNVMINDFIKPNTDKLLSWCAYHVFNSWNRSISNSKVMVIKLVILCTMLVGLNYGTLMLLWLSTPVVFVTRLCWCPQLMVARAPKTPAVKRPVNTCCEVHFGQAQWKGSLDMYSTIILISSNSVGKWGEKKICEN